MNAISARVRPIFVGGLFSLLTFLLCHSAIATAAGFARNFGGIVGSTVVISATAADAAGNEYIAGSFLGATLPLGLVTLARIGQNDGFVAKRDPSGDVLWARNFGGFGSYAEVRALAIDGIGNIYLGGSSFGSLTTPALPQIGSYDAFALKIDATTGATLWAKNYGGIGSTALAAAIAADGGGHVYLVGTYLQNGLSAPALPQNGLVDTFAFRLDAATGEVTWARSFGGANARMDAQAVTTDTVGNAYVGGNFQLGNLTSPALSLIGQADAFALKLDAATGATPWAKNFGGVNAFVDGTAMTSGSVDNVYIGGFLQSADLTTPALPRVGFCDAFVFRLNTMTGNPVWARNFGGAVAVGTAMTTDTVGNIYLGGRFEAADMTLPPLTKVGRTDTFLIKLDPATGSVGLSNSFGGPGAEMLATAVAAGGDGKLHLGGNFLDASLTTPPLHFVGAKNSFAFAIDGVSGNVSHPLSLASFDPGGGAFSTAVAVDGSGNEYVAGYFDAYQLTMDSVTLTRLGSTDAFMAKLDRSGKVLWAKNFGGDGAVANARAAAVDGSGGLYLGGYFLYNSLTTPALALIGSTDAFVVKLDPITGDATWANNYGGRGAGTFGEALALSAGNVYLGGYFGLANLTTPALQRIGFQDAFVFKLDPANGTATWAKGFGGAGAGAMGNAMAVDGAQNLYLGGQFSSADLQAPPLAKIGNQDAFVLKIDTASGNTHWARNLGGQFATVYGQALAVDGAGSAYLGGYFSGDLTTPKLTTIGIEDAFALKLDASNASVLWSKSYGGSGAVTRGESLAIDGAGNAVLGGSFLFASLNKPPLTLIGFVDAFAIKIDPTMGGTLRASNFGGAGAGTEGKALAADKAGNVYFAGDFAAANLTTPPLTYLGGSNAFVLTPTHGVAYDGNGNTGGAPPAGGASYWSGDTFVVPGSGTLTKTGSTFGAWNTAANGGGASYPPGTAVTMAGANITLYAQWSAVGSAPFLVSAVSRKMHGTAGAFDLVLSNAPTNPTTESRAGPNQMVVLSFNKPIANAGIPNVAEGAAAFSSKNIAGNDVIMNFTGVANAQYVTFLLGNVASVDGGLGETASIRVGYLTGDVNQSRLITVGDVGKVNASLLQPVTGANFFLDVNADGKLTVADKGMTNASLLSRLPAP